MHADTVRRLLVGEGGDDLPRLSVPELDVLVIGDAVEPLAIRLELNVSYSLVVTHVGSQALALVVVVPDLDLVVHAGREQQVRSVWKPPDGLDSHRVALPSVDPLLRQEALPIINVLRRLDLALHPGAASVVSLLGGVEHRRDTLLGLVLLDLHRLLLFSLADDLLLPGFHFLLQLLPNNGLVDEAAPLLAALEALLVLSGKDAIAGLGSTILDGVLVEAPSLCCLVPDGLAKLRSGLRAF
mmetsp:Transcript_52457/g.125337  ORF Transcript_52457/g.125337 Transcript_52457/m.125337 type:complete len:241 (+) Transcript_52457:790-1512(+)